jgi:hypothetical protein
MSDRSKWDIQVFDLLNLAVLNCEHDHVGLGCIVELLCSICKKAIDASVGVLTTEDRCATYL